jgi:hypothetical protein
MMGGRVFETAATSGAGRLYLLVMIISQTQMDSNVCGFGHCYCVLVISV